LNTITKIWENSNSLNQIWVTETVHSNLGTIRNIWVGTLDEFITFGYIINIWVNSNKLNRIGQIKTVSLKFG